VDNGSASVESDHSSSGYEESGADKTTQHTPKDTDKESKESKEAFEFKADGTDEDEADEPQSGGFFDKIKGIFKKKPAVEQQGDTDAVTKEDRPKIKVLKTAQTRLEEHEQQTSALHIVSELDMSRLLPSEYATGQMLIFDDPQYKWWQLFIQVLLCFVILYCVVSDESYMAMETGFGSALLNLEGTASAEQPGEGMGRMMFDNFDLRIPEQEKDALFVATHVIGYEQQQRLDHMGEQKKCADIATKCPCEEGEYTPSGRATGDCVDSKCEITGWCVAPKHTEDNANLQERYNALIQNVDEMLVTFQVVIEFPIFGLTKKVDLKRRKLGHNVWRVGDILQGVDEQYENIKEQGIIVVVNMHWNCGDATGDCDVEWNLFRVDNKNTPNSGNYLWVSNYSPPQTVDIIGMENVRVLESRHLQKIYGIKILFNVTGEIKRFSLTALALNVGSFLGILSLVPVMMDILLRKRRADYTTMKDTDIDERNELHAKMIKQMLLDYLKGQAAKQT